MFLFTKIKIYHNLLECLQSSSSQIRLGSSLKLCEFRLNFGGEFLALTLRTGMISDIWKKSPLPTTSLFFWAQAWSPLFASALVKLALVIREMNLLRSETLSFAMKLSAPLAM